MSPLNLSNTWIVTVQMQVHTGLSIGSKLAINVVVRVYGSTGMVDHWTSLYLRLPSQRSHCLPRRLAQAARHRLLRQRSQLHPAHSFPYLVSYQVPPVPAVQPRVLLSKLNRLSMKSQVLVCKLIQRIQLKAWV